MLVWLVAGCGAGRAVEDVETVLVEGYLDPLAEAGITASVEEACRYAGPVKAPWHLSVELRLDAPERQVADVLESEGMVVGRDREPMIVQQAAGGPNAGWNGMLSASGNGSVLSLVYNNATWSGWSGAVGWAETCPAPQG